MKNLKEMTRKRPAPATVVGFQGCRLRGTKPGKMSLYTRPVTTLASRRALQSAPSLRDVMALAALRESILVDNGSCDDDLAADLALDAQARSEAMLRGFLRG